VLHLREGNHSTLLNLSFVGKNLLEEFGIRGHLRDEIQEWDVDLQLFEHL